MKKVCVVTGSRAEYGLLRPIMQAIQESKQLQLKLIVTTMHLAPSFGETYRQIEADGFVIDERIENLLCSDSDTAVVKASGLAMILLSDAFKRVTPDILLLLGDRYETFAAATAAMLMRIPIAHIHGGERTEGAVDEQIRHALTKLAFLHFASTEEYRDRIIQMGESPERVVYSGAPGVDNVLQADFRSCEVLSRQLGWDVCKAYSLVIYHPETYAAESADEEIDRLLQELHRQQMRYIFVYANADHGGQTINRKVEQFVREQEQRCIAVKNLSMDDYLSLLKYTDMLIGNSSSGIIEAASLHVPVVNIGDRQKGRIRAENVIDCTIETLAKAIGLARSESFVRRCKTVRNPYGDGHATERIVRALEQIRPSAQKQFHDS